MQKVNPYNMMSLKERLISTLVNRPVQRIKKEDASSSGVLLTVYPVDAIPHVLVTKRSQNVAVHKGEISLPGGSKEEPDETLLDTAIRETYEELELSIEKDQVLGQLDEVFIPRSLFILTPYVALLEKRPELHLNIHEVDGIIEVALPELLDRKFEEEIRYIDGVPKTFYFFRHSQGTIWGATARILKQFRDIIMSG